jgi:hypothetical protein
VIETSRKSLFRSFKDQINLLFSVRILTQSSEIISLVTPTRKARSAASILPSPERNDRISEKVFYRILESSLDRKVCSHKRVTDKDLISDDFIEYPSDRHANVVVEVCGTWKEQSVIPSPVHFSLDPLFIHDRSLLSVFQMFIRTVSHNI